ncbi:hypothetical protein [Planctomycetes bacterium TBK1r]|uniref:Cytochrome c-552/4 domain-containing protein n=1 Tax=Stieleria magnilauensis TaxID=2527963 RepID=A0ABX5Y061_9BACT|nr:hypothetical protein TBK1r_66980 [Planctomycetes bacterium TBK1r]
MFLPHSPPPTLRFLACLAVLALAPASPRLTAADGSKFAHSDGDARFLHQIHLYDANNRRIEPDSTTPYSSLNTCGRCHDYETISHGWHFNAFLPESADGREGEPWIWTDPRTGTQLPLSYRGWKQTFDPRKIGIDQWAMVRQFGGRLPGGGLGHAPEPDDSDTDADAETDGDADAAAETAEADATASRWPLSGSLEIDCLACHGVSGSYDFNARREQIAEENFAWAATAALKIGTIDGQVSRIKEGSDPDDEATQEKLPKVTYNASRFATDGTVFVDLVRQPQNNACYQCHSNRTVDESGIQPRWTHDEDVHLRAGMQCVDCHRNGIDHHIVRAFPGEEHPSGEDMVTLSCAGCHLGADFVNELNQPSDDDEPESHAYDTHQLAGRLGSPHPAHAGLPPLHFEKLSCTACHGGPLPRDQALGIMTSLAHSLGEKGHRTGTELPRIAGPVYAKGDDGRVYPHRVVWPAYWASLVDGKLQPLDPDAVYETTRRALRVRSDFSSELLSPKLGSSELKEALGEERYRTKPEEWTEEEAAKVEAATKAAGEQLFGEKISAAIAALEEELGVAQAVYVSGGFVYASGDEEETVKKIEVKDVDSIDMVRWPMAHNVRPAGWSLGISGCVECHSDTGMIFASTVSAVGPGPDQGEPVAMFTLQGIDADQRLTWNELFTGRASFKIIVATSITVLSITLLLAAGMWVGRLGRA